MDEARPEVKSYLRLRAINRAGGSVFVSRGDQSVGGEGPERRGVRRAVESGVGHFSLAEVGRFWLAVKATTASARLGGQV